MDQEALLGDVDKIIDNPTRVESLFEDSSSDFAEKVQRLFQSASTHILRSKEEPPVSQRIVRPNKQSSCQNEKAGYLAASSKLGKEKRTIGRSPKGNHNSFLLISKWFNLQLDNHCKDNGIIIYDSHISKSAYFAFIRQLESSRITINDQQPGPSTRNALVTFSAP